MKPLQTVIRRALSLIMAATLLLALNAAPVYALILEMHLTVSPNESAALEESISNIHRFLSDQPGFIEAELTRVSGDAYKLTEEWSSLQAYQEAVQLPDFKALARTVPGSSNWRSETLLN